MKTSIFSKNYIYVLLLSGGLLLGSSAYAAASNVSYVGISATVNTVYTLGIDQLGNGGVALDARHDANNSAVNLGTIQVCLSTNDSTASGGLTVDSADHPGALYLENREGDQIPYTIQLDGLNTVTSDASEFTAGVLNNVSGIDADVDCSAANAYPVVFTLYGDTSAYLGILPEGSYSDILGLTLTAPF